MLKFIAKVWIAGEINDFRKAYNKRKAIKKAEKREKALKTVMDYSEETCKYCSKCFLDILLAFVSMFLGFLFPLFWLGIPVFFVLAIINLIKAIFSSIKDKMNK